MEIIKEGKLKKVIPKQGYYFRDKDDVYIEEHIDENGITIEEHKPHYFDLAYIPDTLTLEDLQEIYVEEKIESTEEV